MSDTTPTVQALRNDGWKVRILYSRLERADTHKKSIKAIRKDYKWLLRKETDIYGPYRAKNGGKTIVELLHKDGRKGVGESLCSPVDKFERKVGRNLAINRALKDAEQDAKQAKALKTYLNLSSIII